MIHLLSAAGALAALAALAAVTYRLAGSVVARRLPRSAVAGAVAATALTLWVGTVRHAALARSAAQPLSGGQKLTPHSILEGGFIATFVVVTAVVFAVSAVLGKRASRRAARQDGGALAARRRAAVRGWGKA
jgi:hypothetical protein